VPTLAAGLPCSAVIETVESFVIETVGSSTKLTPDGSLLAEYNPNERENHDKTKWQDERSGFLQEVLPSWLL
jgi:hypothetical protein